MRSIPRVLIACFAMLLQACTSTASALSTPSPAVLASAPPQATVAPQPTLTLQPTTVPQPTVAPPTLVPTAAALVTKTFEFDSLSAITIATDGTIYLGGWRAGSDALSPTLWGYSAAGELVAFEGDEEGYTSPIQSYTALTPGSDGKLFVLDGGAKQVHLLAPLAADNSGRFPIQTVVAAGSFASDADLTDLAVTGSGDLAVLDAKPSEIVRFSDDTPHSAQPLVMPEQASSMYERAVARDGIVLEVAIGAALQRYNSAGKLLGTWILTSANDCPGAADDPAYSHQGIGDLVIDAEGRRFLSDMGCGPAHTGARILVLDRDGKQLAAWPIGDNRYPEQLALDRSGRVYVVTHVIHAGKPDAVLVFNQNGMLEEQWRGQE